MHARRAALRCARLPSLLVLLGAAAGCGDRPAPSAPGAVAGADPPAASWGRPVVTAELAALRIGDGSPFLSSAPGAECFDLDRGSVVATDEPADAAPCEIALVEDAVVGPRIVHDGGRGVTVAVTDEPFHRVFLNDLPALTFTSAPLQQAFAASTLVRKSTGEVFKLAPVSTGPSAVTFQWAAVGAAPPIPVAIDVEPDSEWNSIFCADPDLLITAAVLSTTKRTGEMVDLDATRVRHATVRLEGAPEAHTDPETGAPVRHLRDVDGDGDADLVVHVLFGETALTCTSRTATLTGETVDGTPIAGEDPVLMFLP
ncbi:MAG: hypothetical protein R3314_10435 [Longimicrobiales bacterium]|nr:hypothetical protein [Longimicrobiales bacterium]